MISIRIEKGFLYSCWRRIRSTSIIKGELPESERKGGESAARGFEEPAAARRKSKGDRKGIEEKGSRLN